MRDITPHKPTRSGPTGEAYAFDAEIENEGDDFPAIGDWYWVKSDSEPSEYSRKHYQYFEREDGTYEWLGVLVPLADPDAVFTPVAERKVNGRPAVGVGGCRSSLHRRREGAANRRDADR